MGGIVGNGYREGEKMIIYERRKDTNGAEYVRVQEKDGGYTDYGIFEVIDGFLQMVYGGGR